MLGLQNFGTLVANMSARVQGACSQLLDLSVGSVVRSIQEASASQALWLQYLVLQLLMACRLSTSSGTQVDTWFADYGLTREPAVAATARITVGRYTSVAAATLLVSTNAQTLDGTQTFVVGADPTVPGYDAALGSGVGGYFIPAGTSSLANVPVTAAIAGSAANVSAGTITKLPGIAGVDFCSNPTPATGGLDAESDAAMKARFPLFIAGLAKATLNAIEAAIAGVQQGMSYVVQANLDEQGRFRPGHFVVTVDDGSGAPSATLKAKVYAAVDAVRALAETFSVQSPQILYASVNMTLTVGPGVSKAALLAPLQSSVAAFGNALAPGAPLSAGRIVQLGFASSAYVTNVSQVSINGLPGDLVPGATTVVKVSSVTVN